MNCKEARHAMLVAEPAELRGETETALAAHIADCADCRRASSTIAEGTAHSDSRSLGVRRIHGDVCHAGRLVWCLCRRGGRRVRDRERACFFRRAEAPRVSLAPLPVARTVSLEVGRGQQATVLKTADPKVTVIWLSSGEGK